MRELLDYRAGYPILADTTYLINHSLGAMPAEAERRIAEYATTWRTRGIRAWGEGWWTMPMTVGDQVGRIVGAPTGSTVMHQNVAIAEAIVLSCFRPTPERNRVVYERANFPSVRYLYQAQHDLEVVVCEDDAGIVDAIDERTLLVPISQSLTTGLTFTVNWDRTPAPGKNPWIVVCKPRLVMDSESHGAVRTSAQSMVSISACCAARNAPSAA